MQKYYQKASGDSGTKTIFSNRSNSNRRLSTDLNNPKISSDSKYDINEKNLDNPIYLEEKDVRNIKRHLTNNINNENQDKKIERVNSSSQRKNNYNYYESKYSKTGGADKEYSDSTLKKQQNNYNTEKGRRTVSLDFKKNDDDNNSKDIANMNIVSSFNVYNTHKRNNVTDIVRQDFSSKKIPTIPKKTTSIIKKEHSTNAIPRLNYSIRRDYSNKNLNFGDTLKKDYSNKNIPHINKNDITIKKDYSNKNLPFVNRNSGNGSSIFKKDYSNQNLPLVSQNIGNVKTEYSSKTFVSKNSGNKTPYNNNIQNKINQTNIQNKNKNDVEKEPMDSIKHDKIKDEKASKTINQDDEIIRKRKPNFPKYERRLSDKNVKVKNEEEKKNVKFDTNTTKISGNRKKSLDIGIRRKKSKKYNTIIGTELSTITYVKSCHGTSTAGRDDDGLTKINQDTYVLEKNVNGVLNFNIFGVLDGHGVNGHFASQFVSRYIISRIKNHSSIKYLDTPKEIYKKLIENKYSIIGNIFCDADVQITKEKFNCEMSGTTCVLVIQLEEHLICANTGDSRAILIYDQSNSENLRDTKIYPLSYDCKPDLPNEKKRIEECGGSVAQMYDEDEGGPCGPFRVWIKGEEYPGIAISRTIGDLDAKKVGVIPNPQIIEYTVSSETKYILICSDGIWEFINSEEAMKIANKYYLRNDAKTLCQDLTNISTSRWLKEDIVVDDITVVAVFF